MSSLSGSARVRSSSVQHVYHHHGDEAARTNVKVVENTRGFNFEVTITGARSADEALALAKDAYSKLAAEFVSEPSPAPAKKTAAKEVADVSA